MTLKDEKNAVKAWSEDLVERYGFDNVREALMERQRLDVLSGASVTCYSKKGLMKGAVPKRFVKGTASTGQGLVVKDIREGARHKLIFICEVAPGEMTNITFSGKRTDLDPENLGIEVTAYELPAVVRGYEHVKKQIEERLSELTGDDDPRFQQDEDAPVPTVSLEELAAEGFGSW
jgi:hypothetical protein